jgi:hypothetical protein
MTTWVHEIFDAGERLVDCSHKLRSLSRAVARIGLREMADELSDIALAVDEARQAASDAVGRETAEGARRAEQATANMIEAFVAGIGKRPEA